MALSKEARRDVRLLGASMLANAMLTLAIVTFLSGGSSSSVPAGGSEALLGRAATTRRFARKLQQVQVEVDPEFLKWKNGVFGTTFLGVDGSGTITISRPVQFLGGVTIVGKEAKLTAGGKLTLDASTSLSVASIDTKLSLIGKSELTVDKLTVNSLAEVGAANKGDADTQLAAKNALKVYGTAVVGADLGAGLKHRTVIYPGKCSMSWEGKDKAVNRGLAKTWIGKAADDSHAKEQLSVYDASAFGTVNSISADEELSKKLAAKVFGNVQLGLDAGGSGPTFKSRTMLYPGKCSMSWNFQTDARRDVLAKSWIGKASDDAVTKDQLAVYGSSSLGTGNIGLTDVQLAAKSAAKVYGTVQVGLDGVGAPFKQRTMIYPGKCSMSWAGPTENLAKTWVGKAGDDSQTKDQLSVYGSVSLVTSRTKPFIFNTTGSYLV